MSNNTISILHISDIHKSKDWDIKNDIILSALINDYERYSKDEEPKIKKPDIIIVSGDVIYGSYNADLSVVTENLRAEYNDSMDFLIKLSDYFLDGDRSKVILIPGNHDISWHHSKHSMVKLELKTDNQESIVAGFRSHNNNSIRWSWKEHCYYEISDRDLYNNRLQYFAQFYNEFYGNRTYSTNPDEQYDVFDFPLWNISIIGFNSCYLNDHLNLEGKINPSCIAKLSSIIRDLKSKGRLLIASWHHNTKGLPNEANYMDSRIIKNLIDNGFSLGFHGHQHKSEIIDDYFRYGENRRMTVISAGTLCGGPDQLPSGEKRQYNVLEMDLTEFNGKLHSREMMNSSSFDLPTWGPGRVVEGIKSSFMDFKIQKQTTSTSVTHGLVEIIDLFKNKQYPNVIQLLLKQDLNDLKIREMLIESQFALDRFEDIVRYFSNPISTIEAAYLINSYINLGDKTGLQKALAIPFIASSTDASIIELRKKYSK